DGIRDFHVTGVQTCALPILAPDHLPALANLGNALLVTGDHRQSLEAYDRALAIKADFAEVHLNVVALQNYLDDSTAARTLAVAQIGRASCRGRVKTDESVVG